MQNNFRKQHRFVGQRRQTQTWHALTSYERRGIGGKSDENITAQRNLITGQWEYFRPMEEISSDVSCEAIWLWKPTVALFFRSGMHVCGEKKTHKRAWNGTMVQHMLWFKCGQKKSTQISVRFSAELALSWHRIYTSSTTESRADMEPGGDLLNLNLLHGQPPTVTYVPVLVPQHKRGDVAPVIPWGLGCHSP